MKTITLILFMAGALGQFAHSAGDSTTAPPAANTDYNTFSESQVVTMNDILENPAISDERETCDNKPAIKALKDSNSEDYQIQLADCVWNEADEQTRDQINQALGVKPQPPGGRSTASNTNSANKAKYEGVQLGNVKQSTNPAFLEVKKHMGNLLRQALYGQVEEGKSKVVDHAIFNRIYETRVSKNLIEVMASFCLQVKRTSDGKNVAGFPVFEYLPLINDSDGKINAANKAEIDRNAAALGTLSAQDNAQYFTNCAASISNVCTYSVASAGGSTCENKKTAAQATAPPPGSTTGTPSPPTASSRTPGAADSCSKDATTKTAACQVEAAMKQARNMLLASAKIRETFEEHSRRSGTKGRIVKTTGSYEGYKGKSMRINDMGNANIYTGSGSGEKSVDDMTTVTSKAFASKYDAKAKAIKEQIDNCSDATSGECGRYLASEDEANKAREALAEFSMRSKVMLERVRKDLNPSNDTEGDNLAKYLAEEGYTKAQITAIKDDATKKDKAVAAIITNYEQQRQAIIKKISEKINKHSVTSTTGSGGTPPPSTGSSGDVAKLKAIGDEISSNSQKFKNIIHYSNIVSGYMAAEKGGTSGGSKGSKAMVKTNAMFREMQDTDSANKGAIEGQIEGASLQQQNGIDTISIERDQIQKLLNHDTQDRRAPAGGSGTPPTPSAPSTPGTTPPPTPSSPGG